jgi:hypothetical protein
MIKKLTKFGDDLAPIKVNPQTPLKIPTDGKQLLIAPVNEEARKARFEAAQALAHAKFGEAFRQLAE